MKRLIFLVGIVFSVCLQAGLANAQKRPVKKPATVVATPTETPQPKPSSKAVSPAEGFYNEGLKCDAKDYDCQVSNYTKAINLQLNTKAVFKKRAAAYMGREDFEKAIDDLTKVIELDLNDATGFKERGKAFLGMRRTSQNVQNAIKDFGSAIDLEPKDDEAYSLRAIALFASGNTAKGLNDLDSAIQLNPKNTETLNYKARIYGYLGNDDKVIETYSKALSIQPNNLVALKGRAQAFETQKKYDLAVKDYSNAIDLGAKDSLIHVNLAGIFERGNKVDEAIKEYSKANLLTPTDSTILFKRAKAYKRMQKDIEALSDISKVIELSPRNARAYEFRCRLEKDGKNLIKAMQDCSVAIGLDPAIDNAFLFRHSILERKFFVLDKLVELKTKYPQIYPAFEQEVTDLRIGSLNGRINVGVEMRTNSPTAQHFLFLALAEEGSYQSELAESHFSRAIELDPTLVDAYIGRARILSAKYTDEAVIAALQDYKRVALLDPRNENLLASNFGLDLKVENVSFYKSAGELFNQLVESNPKDLRPLIYRSLLLNELLSAEVYRRVGRSNGGAINKLHQKLRDEDWNGTKSAIQADLKRVVDLCDSSDIAKVKQSLSSASIMLNSYGPSISGLVAECRIRLEKNAPPQLIADEILALYNASRVGDAYAKSLPAPPAGDSISEGEEMLLIRKQETQRVASEDADRQKKWVEQAAIAEQRALKYEQEVAAIRQKIKDDRARQNAAAIDAIGNLLTTVVQTATRPKSNPSSTTSANSPSNQSSSQINPSSGNGSSGDQTNLPDSSSASAQGDPDFPSPMKGNLYILNKTSPSQNCVNDRGSNLQRCWGSWVTNSFNQVRHRALGPIQDAFNAINDTPNVKSQRWFYQLENTSNSIVEFKYEELFGDGKVTWRYASLAPGGSVLINDAVTFSNASTIGIRITNFRSCENYTREQGGFRCN